MTSADLLLDAYGRVTELVHKAVKDASDGDLAFRPDPDANSIAWLTWHLTRVEDSHFAELDGAGQIWQLNGWYSRSGLELPPESTGYGHTSAEVAEVGKLNGEFLLGYHDSVAHRTSAFIADLNDEDLDRVVDTSWTPHVTLGVRLVSVLSDSLQHAGQALYSRGIADRRTG
jgi:uncharacterized damage-inducible protein DinB